MTNERFDQILTARLIKIKNILGTKAGEYSSADDRLHNFKVAARISGKTPIQALDGMLLKHEVCYRDLVSGKKPTKEYIDEKIGDFINYLILAEALLIENIEGQSNDIAIHP